MNNELGIKRCCENCLMFPSHGKDCECCTDVSARDGFAPISKAYEARIRELQKSTLTISEVKAFKGIVAYCDVKLTPSGKRLMAKLDAIIKSGEDSK